MGLKINVFLSMEEEISIGEDGEVEDECDAGEFFGGGEGEGVMVEKS